MSAERKKDRKFKIGDAVVRRPGTLGNMDGLQRPGKVVETDYLGVHPVVRVNFENGRSECFIEDTYIFAAQRS
jgi:hypothetical protein